MQDASQPILTVSQLTAKIKQLLEDKFPFVWVQGEISNLRRPSSGHLYFTLKDEGAQIAAVLFRGQQAQLKFRLEDGLGITALGRVSVYEPRGGYQLIVEYLEPAGRGSLQLAFEQLKARLSAAGYFDPGRKRPIPFLPRHICLVTSPGGAVVHDMLKVIRRRFAQVQVDILPVSVQGADAVTDITGALALANRLARWDVVVLARGGGSLEDLQAFNSEEVAMAIAASKVPVVSAVGHETDYTIADFVADLRAPTPSAAIEMILPEKAALDRRLEELASSLEININNYINRIRNKYQAASKRLIHPQRRLQELWLRLDDLGERLARAARRSMAEYRRQIGWWSARLAAAGPKKRLSQSKLELEEIRHNLIKSFDQLMYSKRRGIEVAAARLSALDPLAVLNRGFSITRRLPERRLVTRSDQVAPGRRVEVLLAAGRLHCLVEETKS